MEAEIRDVVTNRHVPLLIREWLVAGRLDRREMMYLVELEPEFAANLCVDLGLNSFPELVTTSLAGGIEPDAIVKALHKSAVWRRALAAINIDRMLQPLDASTRAFAGALAQGIQAFERAISRS